MGTMTLFAQIREGLVVYIDYFDSETPFPDDMLFISLEGRETPELGMGWDGENFFVPIPPYVDPRPNMYLEIAKIDRESVGAIRTLLLSMNDLGQGTEVRAQLEDQQSQVAVILQEIADVQPPQQKKK